MVIAKPELPPIQVTIKDLAGNPITGAHVRATYTHSGLGSSGTSAQDGIATVPLLYCDNEPMCVVSGRITVMGCIFCHRGI